MAARADIERQMIRVLVAARNARLLESISLTFARRYRIHTASTLRRCTDLLRQSPFDLVIAGEKLSDGPGLRLLGQIAQSSPATLRVFTARQSTLQRLEGRLEPFGLLRTLPYPIDAPGLLSVLTLARARSDTSHPQAIARLLARLERPQLLPPRPMPPRSAPPKLIRSQFTPSPLVSAQVTPSPRAPSQLTPSQLALPRRVSPRPAPPRLPLPKRHRAPSQITAVRPAAPSRRSRALLAATAVVIVLLTTLTLRQFDAAAQSSNIPTATVSAISTPHPPQPHAPDSFAPSRNLTPPDPKPVVEVSRSPARPPAPAPSSDESDTAAPEPRALPDNTPIADPSTFGSEAAEPIYSN